MHTGSEYKIQDLRRDDIVWVKFVVVEPPTKLGDVFLQLLPRPGVDEYARHRINDAFLRPDWLNGTKRFIRNLIIVIARWGA